jgi:mannose-6-phosphate isomerase-like protein (cupin superfamily)
MSGLASLNSQKMDSGIFTRTQEQCVKIETNTGESIYEFVGHSNGNAFKHSVALVEITEGGHSQAHFHPEAEESYIITHGKGRLVIDDQTRILRKGEVAKIPVGKTHQIFNDRKKLLSFFCICAPAWTPACFVPVENPQAKAVENNSNGMYVRDKQGCFEINTGCGERIYEFLGKNNGAAEKHSIALVEIVEGGSSIPHYHPEAEESYIILEGQAKLSINEEEKIVSSGEVAFIPTGKIHQISTVGQETLKLYCVCAPAWVPEGSLYV